MRYNEYLFAARREKMQVYVDTIKRLSDIEQQTIATIAELQDIQKNMEAEQAQLVLQQQQRQQMALEADAALQSKGDALTTIERERAGLQKVIDQIEKQRALAKAQEEKRQQEEAARQQAEALRQKKEQERLAGLETHPEKAIQKPVTDEREQAIKPREKSSTPAYSAEDLKRLQSTSFTQRKGNLMWPVQGKVINSFGQQRQGSVTWDGLRIQAQSGSDVRAIHGGRVMYADSLPGQGLLLVLDHGDGFMSLYAHNDALLHESGEWVQPGDAIARVGNSGGEKEPGLYFEIRQNGEPVNPLPWLAKR
ncbi:MAG: peptidoglycan DD-metalloendopeptidase family protein [Pseudomonadales bacterium]|nr:peptidoglycan DD-metalloendopeptidase family protein [Cellvibrionales bacterium]MBP8029533.1 peptidoglycan DD-metalloendopeptidase family protein [Pseudomonadales bacterium]